jgi:hypothetical protein
LQPFCSGKCAQGSPKGLILPIPLKLQLLSGEWN